MSKVVIFGTGDYARTAAVYLQEDSEHDIVAFTVHESYRTDDTLLDLPVIAFEELERSHPPGEYAMLVAIGFSRVNQARADVYAECKSRGYELVSYVNSNVFHVGELEIGDNTFIFEANVIQPFVRIGSNVVIWSGNHIGHDSTIGDHCFIASHAVISGNVEIGAYSFVGVNATFRDGITVGPRCIIGADALIMKNAAEGSVFSVRGTEPRDMKSWDLSF